MDFRGVIAYVGDHYILVAGTTLGLFFLTAMVLLIRSIGKREDAGAVNATIDVGEIESAMKRVLSSNPVSVVAASAGAALGAGAEGNAAAATDGAQVPVDSAELAGLQQAIADRDAVVAQLTADLAKAKSSGGGDDSAAKAEIANLKAKIDELQARLAEYAIIEDDIADLSMFKEENARLKNEIAQMMTAAPAPDAVETTAEVPAPAEPNEPQEAAEKFELDGDDTIMKEFAQAVEGGVAPPPEASSQVDVADPAPAPEAPVEPPTEDPPTEDPPTEDPPAEDPPTEDPPAEDPPTEDPPAEDPPTAEPAPEALAAEAQSGIDMLLIGEDQMMPAEGADAETQATAEPEPAPAAAAAAAASVAAEPEVAEDDVFAGSPDPDKMLDEVASISLDNDNGIDALAESLDTDKLLAEVDSLGAKKSAG